MPEERNERAAEPTEHDFKQRLAEIYRGLVEVRVVTVVSNVSVSVVDEGGSYRTALEIPDTDGGPQTDALVTIFDLLDGDVTTIISPVLRDDTALRAFHSEQVAKSLSVLPDNLRLVVDLGRSIIDEISGGAGR